MAECHTPRIVSPPSSPLTTRPCPPPGVDGPPSHRQRNHQGGVPANKLQHHLSPRKFQQVQREQRAAVLRSLPLSPLSSSHLCATRSATKPADPVPWNPAWLPVEVFDFTETRHDHFKRSNRPWSPPKGYDVSIGTVPLREWVRQYELDFTRFESLDKLTQVKLPEALALAEKLQLTSSLGPIMNKRKGNANDDVETDPRFHERFRIAIFAHLLDRTIISLTQSAALGHARSTLQLAREELLRSIYADYDEPKSSLLSIQRRRKRSPSDSSDSDEGNDDTNKAQAYENLQVHPDNTDIKPHTLGFFLRRTPFAVKMREDSRRRAEGFARHEVVLRRVIQSMYRSLGSVFHAWKLFAQAKRDERLSRKGAQLTAMVVLHRGLVRNAFVEWSKAALRSKVRHLKEREAENTRVRQQEVTDLRNEIFLLRDRNTRLLQEIAKLQSQQDQALGESDSDESDTGDGDRCEEPVKADPITSNPIDLTEVPGALQVATEGHGTREDGSTQEVEAVDRDGAATEDIAEIEKTYS